MFHYLDLDFQEKDRQYIKANLMTQSFNIFSCERKGRKGGGVTCIYNERLKLKLLVQLNLNHLNH